MCITGAKELDSTLNMLWDEHREYLRRMLIGLTRNIDLADDILQETYLKALDGITNYRGGDVRAWLSTIARNAFYADLRSPRVRSSVPLDDEICDGGPVVNSTHYLTLLQMRQALTGLKPSLRTALMMKHYGGFTYNEIAKRMDCPVGTAKWRVSTALRQLRTALGTEEAVSMTCKKSRILDYLYGTLSPDEAEEVRQHIENCSSCRKEADEMKITIKALDDLEDNFKMMQIVELDSNGLSTLYTTSSIVNMGPDTDYFEIDGDKSMPIDYMTVQGEEQPFEVSQSEHNERNYTYKIHLTQPVKQGERIDLLSASYSARRKQVPIYHAELRDGKWLYDHKQAPGSMEFIFILALRLPTGAKLLSSDPSADNTRTNGTTTLTWRRLLAPNEQFECKVEYI